MAKYFGIIFGVFLFISTAAMISIIFDNDVGQYLSILAMIGLCISYGILALFDCKLNIYFKQFKNIELQSSSTCSEGLSERYHA